MNNKSYHKLLTYKPQIHKSAMKDFKKAKFPALILISIMLAGAFNLSPAISSLMSNVTIRSSGTIVTTILPLHVEGRYIKNFLNQTVMLRGVNKVEFADDPDGTWMGDTYWTDENVKAELDAMKNWGINVIRCHMSVELWKYDVGPKSRHPSSPYCSISARTAIKRLIEFAAERGMYVILDGFTVRCYWTNGEQDPLPYPPYQTSPGASSVIANEQEYIDYMVSIVNELKGYPNVLFELWNEPTAKEGYDEEECKESWFTVSKRTISAIREAGASQIIVFQWGMGSYVNLDYPPPEGDAAILDWVWEANLTDPLGNIIYSTHIYRSWGAFHHTIPDWWLAWEYKELMDAFDYMMFDEATQKYPLLVGEIGCDVEAEDLNHELTAFENCLSIFNDMGIHYAVFWWREIGQFRLHDGAPDFIPNDAGQILKAYLIH